MSTATIADVAREAGVSTATVSRALSGSSRVSAATGTRVRDAAKRLGYRVNPIARALRKNSTGNIGVLVPSVSNPFFTMLVDEVERQLVEFGLNLYLCTSRDDVEVEAARLSSLCDGAVDGILVSPCDASLSGPALTRAHDQLPVVQIDRCVGDVDIDWIGLDDMHAMDLIIGHLASRGVRTVALVTSDERNSSGQLRTLAARAACAKYGVEILPGGILAGEFSRSWGERAVSEVLNRADLPDAIACTDDQIATGVIQALHGHGLRVPRDILVTGLDDVPHASLITPGLTTVRQPISAIADEAVRLLGTMLGTGGDTRSPQRSAFRGQLVVRASSDMANVAV